MLFFLVMFALIIYILLYVKITKRKVVNAPDVALLVNGSRFICVESQNTFANEISVKGANALTTALSLNIVPALIQIDCRPLDYHEVEEYLAILKKARLKCILHFLIPKDDSVESTRLLFKFMNSYKYTSYINGTIKEQFRL